jgi:hypothetical protein
MWAKYKNGTNKFVTTWKGFRTNKFVTTWKGFRTNKFVTTWKGFRNEIGYNVESLKYKLESEIDLDPAVEDPSLGMRINLTEGRVLVRRKDYRPEPTLTNVPIFSALMKTLSFPNVFSPKIPYTQNDVFSFLCSRAGCYCNKPLTRL